MHFCPAAGGVIQWDDAAVKMCFDRMNKINPRTARIENIEHIQMPKIPDQYKAYAKLQEYVYLKESLVQLKGHAYKSQRHDIHHFQAREPNVFRPYEEDDRKDCLELYDSWAKTRHDKYEDPVYRQMLEENRIVHELAMQYHKALEIFGFVVEINGKIAAYSFGYSLNKDIFCVLLEITDAHTIGLNAFIFNRFCAQDTLRDVKLINTMDDFGLPAVAASKQAYHPVAKPVSYTLTQIA
jgi:hypothetical protein